MELSVHQGAHAISILTSVPQTVWIRAVYVNTKLSAYQDVHATSILTSDPQTVWIRAVYVHKPPTQI